MPTPFPMPATIDAIHDAAVLVQTAWIAAADALPIAPADRDMYVNGLITPSSLQHPYQGNELEARVVNVARQAARVEYGRPPYHLPDRINWAQSRAARRSKEGRYYIRVPFKHAAARSGKNITAAVQRAMMPYSVTRIARQLRPGQYLTGGRAGLGAQGAVYARGMTPYVPRYRRNVRPGYTHALRQEGLRRYPGRGKTSTFLTFRTMTQDSQGWWVPPIPGAFLAKVVERQTRPAVTAMIEAGLRADVTAMLQAQSQGGRP